MLKVFAVSSLLFCRFFFKAKYTLLTVKEEQIKQIKQRVLAEHQDQLEDKGLRAHLLIHELVEKQLEEGEPKEVTQALEHLLSQGVDRHEAIHLIGKVVAREALAMMKLGRPLDSESYRRRILDLLTTTNEPG